MADRWQAPYALTAISSLLCKLQPDAFPIVAVFSLLQNSPEFEPIKSYATKSLVAVFGNAHIVATEPALTQQFLLLPHIAVLELLKSDMLLTDAEATVLLLLSEWSNGKLGRACSVNELERLHDHIRYSHVSIPYLTELCESLHGICITYKSTMELFYYLNLVHNKSDNGCQGSLFNPQACYLPARKTAGHTNPTMFLHLEVSEAQLSRFLRKARICQYDESGTLSPLLESHKLSCQPLYCQGFWFTLELSTHSGEVWCKLVARGVLNLLDMNAWSNFNHGIECDVMIDIRGAFGNDVTLYTQEGYKPVSSLGIGGPIRGRDRKTILSPMDLQWWQPHMIHQCVTFAARFSPAQA